jgi:hypothetical protein
MALQGRSFALKAWRSTLRVPSIALRAPMRLPRARRIALQSRKVVRRTAMWSSSFPVHEFVCLVNSPFAGAGASRYFARSKPGMNYITRIALLLCLALVHARAAVDYSRDILPILSDKCYHCHGPEEKGRKAKLRLDVKESALRTNEPIVVPRKPRESELVRRITTTNQDDVMPPPDSNRTLTRKQIELLTQWIAEGATWGEHWAFVAPHAEKKATIDSLVDARLKKEGLSRSPQADKATVLRRVSLDLTGLPPTVKELDDFLSDTSTNAYERVVDRLLASSRYGERMASEWLDLARYADTHGYQMDRYRPMWPYRDWVIKAFNQNLPYDEFVTWQLAGDLLPNATKEQRLATAFNRLHNQNEEGGIVEEEYRVAYVVDRVNTFGTAFLGLTTECSRCHDHKYDPLSQKDFYSLFAFFQNIDESGQTSYFTDSMPVPTVLLSTDEQDKKLKEFRAKIEAKEKEVAEIRKHATAEFDHWVKSKAAITAPPRGILGSFSFDEVVSNKVANLLSADTKTFAKPHENPTFIERDKGKAVELNGENGFTFGSLGHFSRADAFTIAIRLRASLHAPRAVVLHHSKAPIDAGSRGYELLLENGRVAFGLHHMWPGNSLKVVSKKAIPTNEWVHVAMTYDGSSRAGGVRLFINGAPVEHDVIRDGLWKDITYGGGEPELAIGHRFRDSGFKGGAVDDLLVYSRALAPIEVADLAGHEVLNKALFAPVAQLTKSDRAGLFDYFIVNIHEPSLTAAEELHALRRQQANFINPIPEAMAMEEMPKPKRAFLLKRGAYDSPGEEVFADTPKVLPPMPKDAPRNRLGLAQWLLQPEHPLFARVTVNRAWQLMFGRGIVETSDNFGSQGAQPTNQELLDWLARDFADTRWDIKRLLKTIAMSATYRQSSKASPELLARDPQNELLARGPSRRLTAEMFRDQALALSGLLVEKIGGPSVKPYQPDGIWDIAMGKPKYDQGHGDDLHRRSLYTFWKRTVPPPTMVTFDAADRSYCTARRQQTSTPLQALALLNDVQLVEAARLLAQRALKEGGDTADKQLAWMFRAATARNASERELAVLKKLHAAQRELFASDETAAKSFLSFGEAKADAQLPVVELAAATVVAETLLNHDATVMNR